jgi:hypothetical protein
VAQPSAQTIQQRFGFQDKELTTPKHDELMLWLDNWVDTVLSNRLRGTGRWGEILVQKSPSNAYEFIPTAISAFDLADVPPYPEPIIKKTWEHPIMSKAYIIGFCDMLVDVQPALERPKFYLTDKFFDTHGHTIRSYFEVKPTIPSLGEVIRQIRMYQEYTNSPWSIVSPDDRFQRQLEAQGIGFVKVE